MLQKNALRTISVVFVLAFMVFGHVPIAQAQESSLLENFSPEVTYGWFRVPGHILGLGAIQHPDHLSGTSEREGLAYRLPRGLSLIAAFSLSHAAAGEGNWLQSQNQIPAGVSGSAAGSTTMDIRGWAAGVRKQWSPSHKFNPFVECEVGAGMLHINFDGNFSGTAATPDGVDAVVHTPASDTVNKLIPLGIAGGGFRYVPRYGIALSAGYDWNTLAHNPFVSGSINFLTLFHKKAAP